MKVVIKLLFKEEREKIVLFGKRLLEQNLTIGTGGNISIYKREQGIMLISPSGIPYDDTRPEDIVMMDLDGNVVDSSCKPSSEYHMHVIFYRKRPDINSVVHTHSDYATALACLHQDIEPLHYVIGAVGDRVRCTSYQTFGTNELAEEAYKVIGANNGVLLGNHGVLAIGPTCEKAFDVAADIEFLAKLQIRANSAGVPVLLTEEQMKVVKKKFMTYGQ